MSMDVKKTYRDVEEKSREFGRELDGHDVGDDVGNAGDDIRKNLGNAGDDIRKNLGNAGDEIRRGLDDAGGEMENQNEWSDAKPAANPDAAERRRGRLAGPAGGVCGPPANRGWAGQ